MKMMGQRERRKQAGGRWEEEREKDTPGSPRGARPRVGFLSYPLGYPRPRSSTKPVLGMRCSKKGDVLNTFCEPETL